MGGMTPFIKVYCGICPIKTEPQRPRNKKGIRKNWEKRMNEDIPEVCSKLEKIRMPERIYSER
jgi:hypothetical protein